MAMKYHISLGSNIGAREKNLDEAISLLDKTGVKIIRKSSVYETSPVGNTAQPWFLNQVLEVEAELEPREFLRLVKGIENKIGRIFTTPKGPRCIDVDILLAEKRVVRSAELIIPHPELAKRNFILVPLTEIADEAVHPVLNERIGELCRKSKDNSIVRLFVPSG
jgi:2-amino-4-hydroxy-6-hydroxymethyldihydropteridine diphosphokinase